MSDEQKLQRRAENLARTQRSPRETTVTAAVVTTGAERIAIPVEGLREIVTSPPIAPLFGLPPWLSGIVQIRGELLSVVDLARWFGLASSEEPEMLVVMEGPEGPIGLLADSVVGFREIYADEISETFGGSSTGRPIRATTKDLVTILDLEGLLENKDLIVGQTPLDENDVQGGVSGTSLEKEKGTKDE